MQPVAMASSLSIIVRSIGLLSWGVLRLQSAFRTRSISLSTYLVPEAQSWQLSCVFLGGFLKFNLSFPKWVEWVNSRHRSASRLDFQPVSRKGFRLGYTSEHVQLSPGGYLVWLCSPLSLCCFGRSVFPEAILPEAMLADTSSL
ncbi:hypothetical protein C8R46DRAFT_1062756 [Mycena filopes]|nr:hypothetical protein C8R46DRAFT_1062756 [Mycena filopes]